MNINRKLDEIRKQPEHIRIRYVWLMVAVSMFLIILIWIFSFKSTSKTTPSNKATMPDLGSIYESSEQELPSIQDFMDRNSAINQGEGSMLENNSASQDTASEGNINNSGTGQ
jgi:hypothetical protein